MNCLEQTEVSLPAVRRGFYLNGCHHPLMLDIGCQIWCSGPVWNMLQPNRARVTGNQRTQQALFVWTGASYKVCVLETKDGIDNDGYSRFLVSTTCFSTLGNVLVKHIWLDLIWCDILGLYWKFPIRDLPEFLLLRYWVRRLHGKKWQKPSQVFLGQFLYYLFWLRMCFFLDVFFVVVCVFVCMFACLMVCWIGFLHVASGFFFVENITRVMLRIVGWMSEKLLISKKLKLAYHPGSEPDLS